MSTKPSLVVARSDLRVRNGAQAVGLLLGLGVPKQMLYVGRVSPRLKDRNNRQGSFARRTGKGSQSSFWTRSINHLAVLERARELYRQKITSAHPDKPGGNHKKATKLNTVWTSIEELFKRHGFQLGLFLLLGLVGCQTQPTVVPATPQRQVTRSTVLPPLPSTPDQATATAIMETKNLMAMAVIVPGLAPVNFAFNASPDPSVTGYRIYYGAASGNYTNSVNIGNRTTATISMIPGATYYIAVVAYDAAGVESDFSNELSYLVPNPTPIQLFPLSPLQVYIMRTTWPGPAGTLRMSLDLGTNKTWTPVGPVSAGMTIYVTNTFPAAFYQMSVP